MNNQTTTILVIEDEAAVRENVAEYLRKRDYRVVVAKDGREGLLLFETEHPDIIILDLDLPEIKGLDILRKVKEASPDTPVIIFSGTGRFSDAIKALQLGAQDYVTKPIVDLAALAYAVERTLDRLRLVQENRRYQEQLEQLVRERTTQLQNAYQNLEQTNDALERKNTALQELLDALREQRDQKCHQIIKGIDRIVMPMLLHLKQRLNTQEQTLILDEIEHSLSDVASPQVEGLTALYTRLTPSEIRTCKHIQRGMSTKEIASLEHISPTTVKKHREHIRKKLGITNKEVNLAAYLSTESPLNETE